VEVARAGREGARGVAERKSRSGCSADGERGRDNAAVRERQRKREREREGEAKRKSGEESVRNEGRSKV